MAFGGLAAYMATCATCRVRYNNDMSCQVHPITCHEGTEGWQKYSPALSLIMEQDVCGLVNATPLLLGPREGATISFK